MSDWWEDIACFLKKTFQYWMTGASVVRDIPREDPELCHNIISAPQMLFSLTRLGPKISIQGLVLIGAGYWRMQLSRKSPLPILA